MWKLLRRLFWLAALTAAGYAVYTTWQRRQEPEPAGPPSWPPFDEPTADEPEPTAPTTEEAPVAERRWAEPLDGRCPPGYPIKGNDNSGIYHVPGGRFYERTVPDRCYADEDDAQADGYRRAKA